MSTPKGPEKQRSTDDLPKALARQFAVLQNDEELRSKIYLSPGRLLQTPATKKHSVRVPYKWEMRRTKEALDVQAYFVPQGEKYNFGEQRVVVTVQGGSFSRPVFISRSPQQVTGQYFLWHGQEKGFDYENGEVIKYAPWYSVEYQAELWGHKQASSGTNLTATSIKPKPKRPRTSHTESDTAFNLDTDLTATPIKPKPKRPRTSHTESDTAFNPSDSDEDDDIPLSQRSRRYEDKVWSAAHDLAAATATSTTSANGAAPTSAAAVVAETPTPSPLTSTSDGHLRVSRPTSSSESDAITVVPSASQRIPSVDLAMPDSTLVVKIEPSAQSYMMVLSEEASKVNVVFFNAAGQACRTKAFGKCSTVGKIFMNAVAAKLLSSSEEECCLGISLSGVEDWELRLLKDDEDEEDDALYPLKTKLEEMCQYGSVGSVEVRVV